MKLNLCSEHAVNAGYDVCGTGICTAKIFLIDQPQPWPSDINETRFWNDTEQLRRTDFFKRSRYLLTIPRTDRPPFQVFIRDRENTLYASGSTLEELESAAPAELSMPRLLICGHGTRDFCCGTKGVNLASEIAESIPDLHTEIVSHTAGHRFAPTGISMPGGNSWAHMTPDLCRRVKTGSLTKSDYQKHYRGWWGAKNGAQQQAVRHFRVSNPNSAIESIETDGDIVTITAGSETRNYSVTESGREEIPQCQVEGGGTIKYRNLFTVAEVN